MFFYLELQKPISQPISLEYLILGEELSERDQGPRKLLISVLGRAAGLMDCYRALLLNVLTHLLKEQTEVARDGEKPHVMNSTPSV